MAAAIVRLDLMARGEADPVEAKREEADLQARMDAMDAWEAALPGGSGYDGPRGQVRYDTLARQDGG